MKSSAFYVKPEPNKSAHYKKAKHLSIFLSNSPSLIGSSGVKPTFLPHSLLQLLLFPRPAPCFFINPGVSAHTDCFTTSSPKVTAVLPRDTFVDCHRSTVGKNVGVTCTSSLYLCVFLHFPGNIWTGRCNWMKTEPNVIMFLIFFSAVCVNLDKIKRIPA